MKLPVSLFLSICLVIVACDHGRKAGATAAGADAVLTGNWELRYVTGTNIIFDTLFPAKKPRLTIDLVNRKVSGNTSCNSYEGKVSVDDTSIHFDEALAVTEMMCADGDNGERTYLEMLRNTNHYSIRKDTLQLLADTLLLMRFIKI